VADARSAAAGLLGAGSDVVLRGLGVDGGEQRSRTKQPLKMAEADLLSKCGAGLFVLEAGLELRRFSLLISLQRL
jgi:hypothetical protein